MTARLRRRRNERGQGIVEFALLVPVFMLLLLGMLEFGFVFDHTLTIQYASREGARVGAALVFGGGPVASCGTGLNPASDDVDPNIIAAVVRVLDSPGSRVDPTKVPTIRIYDADSSGNQIGSNVNVWTYAAGSGPTIDGRPIGYTRTSNGWPVCTRTNTGSPPDSIGVALTYTYDFQTALGSVLRFFGGPGFSSVTVSDKTVMSMNPTD